VLDGFLHGTVHCCSHAPYFITVRTWRRAIGKTEAAT